MKKVLYGGKVLYKGELHEDLAVVFEDKILEIIPASALESRTDAEKIAFSGILSPGFVDIHIHGNAGSDTMDATPEALETISKSLVERGTTSFLATTMTMSREAIDAALDNVRTYMAQKHEKGAEIVGVHMEGPFINVQYKGAQNPEYIQKPDADWVRKHLDIVKLITMAPEVEGASEFIEEMSKDLTISLGHSAATYECACDAFRKGARHITHCFNGMTGLHHRNPGLVGAALAQDFSVEFICDGVHIHKDLFQPIIGIKPRDKRVLVTDGIRATTLEDGIYDLGGQEVKVENGVAVLLHGNSIAGSTLTLDKALRNVDENTKFSLPEILEMMSKNPAEVVGISDRKGTIEVGKDADFTILSEDLAISDVFVRGVKQ